MDIGASQTFKTLLDTINRVAAKILRLHAEPGEFGTGVKLFRSENHTVRTIGMNPGINVTTLAELMGVTKDAVSQTAGKLFHKGLVLGSRAPSRIDPADLIRLKAAIAAIESALFIISRASGCFLHCARLRRDPALP